MDEPKSYKTWNSGRAANSSFDCTLAKSSGGNARSISFSLISFMYKSVTRSLSTAVISVSKAVVEGRHPSALSSVGYRTIEKSREL
jgi:hypothetical protein